MTIDKFPRFTSVIIAVFVLLGISLHDTKLDTMTQFAIALPALLATYEAAQLMHLASSGDAHTHVEHVSSRDIVRKATATTPKIQVRTDEDKKYRTGKRVPKGFHDFDGYYIPVNGMA